MIPRNIHQIWLPGKDRLRPRYQQFSSTWRARNPNWEYKLWDEPELRAWMQVEAAAWLPIFDAQPEPCGRADVARYALLQRFGGLYADIDTMCTRSVDCLFGSGSFHCSRFYGPLWKSKLSGVPFDLITNSVIACTAGHPIWGQVLAHLQKFHGPQILIASRTGSLMLWPFLRRFAERHPGQVRVIRPSQALVSFYIPTVLMKLYGWGTPANCILDFNDAGRRTLKNSLVHRLRRY